MDGWVDGLFKGAEEGGASSVLQRAEAEAAEPDQLHVYPLLEGAPLPPDHRHWQHAGRVGGAVGNGEASGRLQDGPPLGVEPPGT